MQNKIKIVRTSKQFLESLKEFSNINNLIPRKSSKLLNLIYKHAENLPKELKDEQGNLKLPLIISFHPKLSLLNNNVHEVYFSQHIAKKFGMIPIWIPYIYDTGYKTAENKIRLPTYVLFEGKYIPIRASAKIRGNIIAVEPALKKNEIIEFFNEIEKHELYILSNLKNMLNPFNFGHYLFNLKRKILNITSKQIKNKIESLKSDWIKIATENSNCKRLSDSLSRISLYNLKKMNIDVALLNIDDILGDMIKIVFEEILQTPKIKQDPSKLENLFIHYNLKTKERTPVLYAGDFKFIAFDEFDNKVYEGTLDDLVQGIKDHSILPTGHLIMTLFTAMGCKIVLGGEHTINYYPDYFEKAYDLLEQTEFNTKMHLISYGNVRFMDLRNLTDIMSVIRILDKVGSRNYIQKSYITIPDDIIDHLDFLNGVKSIPIEYKTIAEQILKQNINEGITAYQKELARNQEVHKLLEMNREEILKNPTILKKYLPDLNINDLNIHKLEFVLENIRADADSRLVKMEENIKFEQHILGGTLLNDDNKTSEVIYNGILLRSNRYPSLFEMVFYEIEPLEEFEVEGQFEYPESGWILAKFRVNVDKYNKINSIKFDDYKNIFEYLIPNSKLPKFLK